MVAATTNDDSTSLPLAQKGQQGSDPTHLFGCINIGYVACANCLALTDARAFFTVPKQNQMRPKSARALKVRIVPKNVPKKRRSQPRTSAAASRFVPIAPKPIVNPTYRFERGTIGTTVRNTEQIKEVMGGAYQNYSFPINPRYASTFPWLSRIAQCYDMYRINSLTFRYQPTCPTTREGEVVMFFDYDPSDDNGGIPITAAKAMSGAKATVCTAGMIMTFSPPNTLDLTHKLYCESDVAVLTGAASSLRCPGRFWMGAWGAVDGDTPLKLGVIYVTYDISFFNPEQPTEVYARAARVNNVGSATFGPSVNIDTKVLDVNAVRAVVSAAGGSTGPTAVQEANLQTIANVVHIPEAAVKLAAPFMQLCNRTAVELKKQYPLMAITRQLVMTDIGVDGLPVMLDTAFDDDDNPILCGEFHSGPREFSVYVWARGTWTPDTDDTTPCVGWQVSSNITTQEYLYGLYAGDLDVAAATVLPNVTVTSYVQFTVNNNEPFWVRPYIGQKLLGSTATEGASGTFVAPSQNTRVIINTSPYMGTWDVKEDL